MRKSILYVDDEPYFVRSLIEALEDEGYRVYRAVNGTEAISQVKDVDPDLVILDIIMPTGDDVIDPNGGMRTGLRDHEIFRQRLGYRGPIVFLTVVDDPKVHQTIRRLERNFRTEQCPILVKPVLPTELIQQVKQLIGDP